MPQANIFRWRDTNGWIVLSGGGAIESADVLNIEAALLNHTISQGPIAYVWAASDLETADLHMDSLRELGARTGYLLDILTEDDATLKQQLGEAGVIILGDGPRHADLRDALTGFPWEVIEDTLRRGATLYVVGQSAAMMGSQELNGDALTDGTGWLLDALILPAYTPDQAEHLRAAVAQLPPGGYGLGIAEGAALAFGPNGEVEVWGNAQITVSLNQSYDTGA